MENGVRDIFFYMRRVAERMCLMEAAAGTSGNISVRADHLPVESFPKIGARARRHQEMDRDFPGLHKQRFLITGSGKNLRYIKGRPHECLALIEVVEGGCNILWGLDEGEKITSEHPAHFTTYEKRPEVNAFIHAQPRSINALTRLFRSPESLNQLLNAQHEQIRLYCPNGIGLVAALTHGSYELADAVASCLTKTDICAVFRHGTFSVGEEHPVKALNWACDLQEYYHDAAMTFLENPWLRLLPVDFLVKNLIRVSHLPLGSRLVNVFLRPPATNFYDGESEKEPERAAGL